MMLKLAVTFRHVIYTYIKMHRNIIVASNNTDLCHHFSGVCLNVVCSAGQQ